MPDPAELTARIKRLLVEELMLQQSADEIADDTPLFGNDGLGLDSVDALQLVVALDKQMGLKVADSEAAKKILLSVATIRAAVLAMGR